jgi:hypothetical protein
VLTELTPVLGTDHLDTLGIRHRLAWVQAQRGDLAGAETEYRAVLADRTRALGADHPETLDTKDALTVLRARQP